VWGNTVGLTGDGYDAVLQGGFGDGEYETKVVDNIVSVGYADYSSIVAKGGTAWTNSGEALADANGVVITDSITNLLIASGGIADSAHGDAYAVFNQVSINGGTIREVYLYGGDAHSASGGDAFAENNVISLANTSISYFGGDIYAGMASAVNGTASAINNTVNIQSGTVLGDNVYVWGWLGAFWYRPI